MPDPQTPALRASDADRERVAALLQRHFTEGRLNYDELQERLEQTYAARTMGELSTLTADLPAEPSVGRTPAAPRASSGRVNRRRDDRSVLQLVLSYIILCLLLIAVWSASGHHGGFWPIWPIIGLGAVLARRLTRRLGP